MEPNKTEKFLSLDLIDQVQITRSFSKKVQINQYEPIEVFASAQAILKGGQSEADIQTVSRELNALAIKEVERDLKSYYLSHKSPF